MKRIYLDVAKKDSVHTMRMLLDYLRAEGIELAPYTYGTIDEKHRHISRVYADVPDDLDVTGWHSS